MSITTISSREFNQDAGKAKKAAKHGPVMITDRGQPAHVLLTIDEYRRLTGEGVVSIVDLLASDAITDFEPDRIGAELFRPADLA